MGRWLAFLIVLAVACGAAESVAGAGDGVATVELPVVACKGQTMTGDPPRRPPKTLTAALSAEAARQLAYYAFEEAFVLAPAGWTCEGASGSDGAVVTAHPRRGFFRAGAGKEPSQAVRGYVTTPGWTHPLLLACPYFPTAARELKGLSLPWIAPARGAHPLHESQALASRAELDFLDPARVRGTGSPSGGPNPSRGFVLFSPSRDNRLALDAAAKATCELAAARAPLCAAILADFRRRFFRAIGRP